jgi:hypothetical protein
LRRLGGRAAEGGCTGGGASPGDGGTSTQRRAHSDEERDAARRDGSCYVVSARYRVWFRDMHTQLTQRPVAVLLWLRCGSALVRPQRLDEAAGCVEQDYVHHLRRSSG